MKPSRPFRRTTALALFISITASATPTESESSSLEDTLHQELNFAFNNLPREVLAGQELQPFFVRNNFLGGQAPQPIVFSGDTQRPFEVGGDTFVSEPFTLFSVLPIVLPMCQNDILWYALVPSLG